ncbi:hypothetical protein ACFSQ7_34635 [Paenibacillus rhizoplanae]
MVLFAGDDLAGRVPEFVSTETLMADINQFITHGEYAGAAKSIELLFSHLSRNGGSSAIYVKYLCSDLVRNAFEQSARRQKADFQQTVERIFKKRFDSRGEASAAAGALGNRTGQRPSR